MTLGASTYHARQVVCPLPCDLGWFQVYRKIHSKVPYPKYTARCSTHLTLTGGTVANKETKRPTTITTTTPTTTMHPSTATPLLFYLKRCPLSDAPASSLPHKRTPPMLPSSRSPTPTRGGTSCRPHKQKCSSERGLMNRSYTGDFDFRRHVRCHKRARYEGSRRKLPSSARKH